MLARDAARAHDSMPSRRTGFFAHIPHPDGDRMNTSMTGKPKHSRPDIANRLELSDADGISVELSSRRTGMSFQRTRMSADRTLMSIMRTALSLIGFGFTIFQVFTKAREARMLPEGSRAPQNFGTALVVLGVLMLALGIAYHVQFMLGLRAERATMASEGLIHGQSRYPVSLTLITASLLLLIGLLAISSMVFGAQPFG
jgi:inner membrane protein YidH